MSINGNLNTMELAELFQWLAQGNKNGTLVIHNGAVEKRISLKGGKIISVASSDPTEWLGHFLVSHGFIDEVVLAKAMEMQEANRMMLGKILITIGAVSEDDLDRMLRLKSQETLYEVFTWSEGEFRFHDGELPIYPMVPMSINVTAVVLEGVSRIDDWTRIRKKIPSRYGVPVAVAELEAEADDALARSILALVDDDRSVEEIALHSHASEYQVCRVLFREIQHRRLKVVRPRPIPGGDERPAAAGQKVDVDSLLATASSLLAEGAFEAALRHLRAAQSLEPDAKRIREAAKRAEGVIRRRVEEAGIRPKAIPRLERSFQELTQLQITPQEGFILTRINDAYDVQTILQISPMPALEGALVLYRLLEAGHIRIEKGRDEGANASSGAPD